MCWLIRWSTVDGRWATVVVLTIVLLSCKEQETVKHQDFFDVDSLIDVQLRNLNTVTLSKSVSINGKEEQVQLTPDSTQWKNELDIFRELDQVNKPTFRDAYVVNDIRDTNSNLMVREIRARRPVPVSLLRLYYLRTPDDIRKIEATVIDENSIYTNTRQMLLEFERDHSLRRYRVQGSQKMVMDDSVNFVIAGTIEQ